MLFSTVWSTDDHFLSVFDAPGEISWHFFHVSLISMKAYSQWWIRDDNSDKNRAKKCSNLDKKEILKFFYNTFVIWSVNNDWVTSKHNWKIDVAEVSSLRYFILTLLIVTFCKSATMRPAKVVFHFSKLVYTDKLKFNMCPYKETQVFCS